MATRYRLPAELGGGEYDEEPISGAIASCKGFIIGGHTVAVHEALLTEVPPPLPPEPPILSIANFGDEGPFIRRTMSRWQNLGGHDFDYADLCRFGPPVLLVPDPMMAGAPELPYRRTGDEYIAISIIDGQVFMTAAWAENLVSKTVPFHPTVEDALAILAAHRQLGDQA